MTWPVTIRSNWNVCGDQALSAVCHTLHMTDRAEIQVQAQWALDPSIQSAAANQIMIQDGIPGDDGTASEAYLTFGHVNPPIMDGPPEGTDIFLPIFPVARLILSRDRIKQLHALLGTHLANTAPAER